MRLFELSCKVQRGGSSRHLISYTQNQAQPVVANTCLVPVPQSWCHSFLVTKYTSPLTLQVLGNAKGVIAAIVSVYIFLNPVTVSGVQGACIELCRSYTCSLHAAEAWVRTTCFRLPLLALVSGAAMRRCVRLRHDCQRCFPVLRSQAERERATRLGTAA